MLTSWYPSHPCHSYVLATRVTTIASTAESAAARRIPSRNSNRRRSTAEVPLRRHDLVVKGPQLQAQLRPGIKVIRRRDSAAAALGLADGPVLAEGGGALDGGLVDARGLVDVVGAAVRGDAAEAGGARGRVVGAEVLDDVVLDERVGRPAVHGEVAVAVGLVVGVVVDRSGGALVSGEEWARIVGGLESVDMVACWSCLDLPC